MSTSRITRADAAEHFAANVAGQHPPRAKALLDDIWGGKREAAKPAQIYTVDTNVSMDAHEPIREVVVPMGQRVGFTDLTRMLGPGVFEFTVPEDGYYSVSYAAPPFEGPQNRQGRRAHARKMRKLGLGLVDPARGGMA